MSVYTPGIPNATDLISSSQQPIKNNFGQLNTQFGVEHVPFWTGSANGSGLHKQVTLANESTPNPSPLAGNGTVYGSQQNVIIGGAAATITEAFYESGDTGSVHMLSCIKAWANFNGTTTGTNPPTQGFNVTSITRTAAGVYTVTFTNAMDTTAYGVIANGGISSNFNVGAIVGGVAVNTTSCQIVCRAFTGGNVGSDVNPICLIVLEP